MLAEAVENACRRAWAVYRDRFASETVYAFGLHVVSEDGLILGSAYATEEATLARAEEYAFMLGGDVATRAKAIRWLDADWMHSNDLREEFAAANDAIRARSPDPAELRAIYETVLAKLDREGLFGDLRLSVVLAVFGPDRDASIARLNPSSLRERFTTEASEGERLYRELAV